MNNTDGMDRCVNEHVNPDRYANGNCKQCQYDRNKRLRQKGGTRYEAMLASNRRRSASLREETLSAYGGKCACCGETELDFLVIDHIDGDGSVHRKQLVASWLEAERTAGAGRTTYRWLKNNGWPEGFQVLCANCNTAKARPQGCPHQRATKETRSEV